MDPTQCLKELLELKDKITAALDGTNTIEGDDLLDTVSELVDRLDALHEWMKKDGFLPKQWQTSYTKASFSSGQNKD